MNNFKWIWTICWVTKHPCICIKSRRLKSKILVDGIILFHSTELIWISNCWARCMYVCGSVTVENSCCSHRSQSYNFHNSLAHLCRSCMISIWIRCYNLFVCLCFSIVVISVTDTIRDDVLWYNAMSCKHVSITICGIFCQIHGIRCLLYHFDCLEYNLHLFSSYGRVVRAQKTFYFGHLLCCVVALCMCKYFSVY